MEEVQSLVALSSDTKVVLAKAGEALPSVMKKDDARAPEVGGGYVRLFPVFYELNHQTEVDPKTKKRTKERESFTRFLQVPGQPKTEVFTTKEVYFIPLDFKFSRMFYAKGYDPNAQKTAPDCQSDNGIVPLTNKLAKDCKSCDHSKWAGDRPPACGEMPVILGLDITGGRQSDEALKKAVTREAFTLSLKKSAISEVKKLMKTLAEPVLFDDGSYGQVDMSQFVIKMTAEVAISDGKEAAWCVPKFEIAGMVPHEVSTEIEMQLKTPVLSHGNKTVLEMFMGRTESFTDAVADQVPPTTKVNSEPPPTVQKENLEPSKEVVEVESTKVLEDEIVF